MSVPSVYTVKIADSNILSTVMHLGPYYRVGSTSNYETIELNLDFDVTYWKKNGKRYDRRIVWRASPGVPGVELKLIVEEDKQNPGVFSGLLMLRNELDGYHKGNSRNDYTWEFESWDLSAENTPSGHEPRRLPLVEIVIA